MKKLGNTCSDNKFEFANTCHHSFKCMVLSNVVFSSLMSMSVIVSLRSVPYCLLSLSFVLHCLYEEIDSYCIQAYDLVSTLAHQLPAYSLQSWAVTDGNSHSFAICCDWWSTWPSCRNILHPEHSSENLSTACSITVYSCALHVHRYFLYPLRLHFYNNECN